jgi:hypothetical protein
LGGRCIRWRRRSACRVALPRPEGEGGHDASGVADAAGGDDGYVDGVYDLGYEGHGGDFADVAAAFHAFGDDGVYAGARQPPGESDGGDDGDDACAALFEGADVFSGVAGAGGDDGDFFVDDDLHDFADKGRHEHDVDAEGFGGQRLCFADFLPQGFGRHVAGADEAESTGFGNGGGEFGGSDPGHAPLQDGVFYAQ